MSVGGNLLSGYIHLVRSDDEILSSYTGLEEFDGGLMPGDGSLKRIDGRILWNSEQNIDFTFSTNLRA